MSKAFIAVAVAAAILLPVGCGAYSIYTSAVTAPSRVISKTLETDNIIFNYEWFFNVNSQFQSRLAQIKEYKTFEGDEAEKYRLRTELGAMKQSCRELANNYNANSAKLNRAIFRSHNLPLVLDAALCE